MRVPKTDRKKRPAPQVMPRPAVIQMALAVVKPLTSFPILAALCLLRPLSLAAVVITFQQIE